MPRLWTALLAVLLLLSGVLTPRLEAASDLAAAASDVAARLGPSCGREAKSSPRGCCCRRAARPVCPCAVQPRTPAPAPQRATPPHAPSRSLPVLAAAPGRPAASKNLAPRSLAPRAARHGHRAPAGPRRHVLLGVFLE